MPLPALNLDDRTFQQLVDEAKLHVARGCPAWTDLSPGDPGIMLLEVFAHLTEVMIYRLNRLPEKAYIEFLSLIGVHVEPPSAASAALRFSRKRSAETRIEIPRGTRVAVERAAGASPAEPVIFATASAASLAPGLTSIEVVAYHGEFVEAELVGHGTGLPGLSVFVRRPPIVAPAGSELQLVVGVEVPEGELAQRVPAVRAAGKTFRIWNEVESFTNLPLDSPVYLADRATGVISFAPALRRRRSDSKLEDRPEALAAVPPAGREIRLWYWRGGGPDGNVAAGTLTTLRDPILEVEVTNPSPAIGGRAGESVENALLRGPQEFHSLQRAVTARDFELLARRSFSGAVGRARAFTKADLWVHATPGTVEVLLVPDVTHHVARGTPLPADRLRQYHSKEARAQIQTVLDQRKPLGTTCLVNWARYKTVRIKARIVAYREGDLAALKARVLERLYERISPLPGGWPFGQALRASHVYDIVLAEPGVNYADQVRLLVDDVPEGPVSAVAADAHQPHTWFCGAGERVFRSLNDADGWEMVGRFAGESVESLAVHPSRAGMVAVSTRRPGDKIEQALYISSDCGETWTQAAVTAFKIEDLAWMLRDGVPVLMIATGVGLYEYTVGPGAVPVQVLVDQKDPNRGFYAVTVLTDVRGGVSVAVAAQATGGVYMSSEPGRPGSFRMIGLLHEDVRVLLPQYSGPNTWLWAGFAASGGDEGKGCARIQLVGSEPAAGGWEPFAQGWRGGSCWSLAFHGLQAFAGSHQAGVLRLDASAAAPSWEASSLASGLPHREVNRLFHRVDALAVNPSSGLIICGGPVGVYRSSDRGTQYELCASRQYTEKVTLPESWLFCSGEHYIDVVSDDDTRRD